MLEPHERFAIFRLIQADRPNNRQSLQTAALYAGQILLAVTLLMAGYSRWGGAASALWAVVSAILVVQPAMEQSIATSAVRIAANTVGGVAGILVAYSLGNGIWQFLLALVVVVFICDLLKLDLGLRTACVSVAIIMLKSENGQVLTTSRERLGGVVIGCVTALCVQLVAEAVRKKLGWHGPDMSAVMNRRPGASDVHSG
jgi:uncharacterized membrane protein YgaE (UPF0421/DUF939 family)